MNWLLYPGLWLLLAIVVLLLSWSFPLMARCSFAEWLVLPTFAVDHFFWGTVFYASYVYPLLVALCLLLVVLTWRWSRRGLPWQKQLRKACQLGFLLAFLTLILLTVSAFIF